VLAPGTLHPTPHEPGRRRSGRWDELSWRAQRGSMPASSAGESAASNALSKVGQQEDRPPTRAHSWLPAPHNARTRNRILIASLGRSRKSTRGAGIDRPTGTVRRARKGKRAVFLHQTPTDVAVCFENRPRPADGDGRRSSTPGLFALISAFETSLNPTCAPMSFQRREHLSCRVRSIENSKEYAPRQVGSRASRPIELRGRPIAAGFLPAFHRGVLAEDAVNRTFRPCFRAWQTYCSLHSKAALSRSSRRTKPRSVRHGRNPHARNGRRGSVRVDGRREGGESRN
jgi:hypothetical protein